MTREEMAQFFREHLADDDAHASREAFCRAATEGIVYVGRALDLSGYVQRNEHARGVGLAARIGGALATGACALLDAHNAYAAAALIRQVVEVEYLLWTVADDHEDAGRWVRASRSQLSSRFRPAAMRERSGGRFRSGEYRSHCERGGHPTPQAWSLLSASAPLDPVRSMWADLGQHLESAWGLLTQACEAIGYPEASKAPSEAVEAARRDWHERDALASRLGPLPGNGD